MGSFVSSSVSSYESDEDDIDMTEDTTDYNNLDIDELDSSHDGDSSGSQVDDLSNQDVSSRMGSRGFKGL